MQAKIKVGDYVRRLPQYRWGYWNNNDKSYKVTEVNYSGETLNLEGEGGWNLYRFELVDSPLTIEQKIALAESYVGKNVILNGSTHRVDKWEFRQKGHRSSNVVENYHEKHGHCIAVYWGGCCDPVEDVTLAPEFKEHKLNDTYTARVYDDRVEVGCQTFTKDTIKQLAQML